MSPPPFRLEPVEAWWRTVLVGVVLISILLLLVVFLIHLLGMLLGLVVSFQFVDFVHATGFSQLVNLPTNKSSKEFFCKCVGDWLA